MTFSITVPNASQSPGLFPTQNNTNFQRIKDIVNNDHNWTDATSLSQGIHKQCTLINRTTPVGLPAGNGILYSQDDTSGNSQLRWYNGSTDTQVSNAGSVLLAFGSDSLTTGSTASIYTLPDNSFGYMYFWKTSAIASSAYVLWQTNGYAIMQMTATYLGNNTSTTSSIVPIIFNNSIVNQSLNVLPKTSNASYDGTYEFRIFKVI